MIHVIVNANARAGRKQKASEIVEQALKDAGIAYTLYLAAEEGDTRRLCNELSSVPGEKTIWVVGGDGTANEAINGLCVNEELSFVYLPAGSGNDLARGLKLPQKLREAIDKVLSSTAKKEYDYGEMELICGEETVTTRFAGSSGIGYDAKVCEEVNTSKLKKRLNKFHLGKLAYYMVAIRQVFVNPRFQVTLIPDGGVSRSYSDCIFLCMMNHRYEGGGLKMAPEADPCDGQITVTFAHNMRPLKVFLIMPLILTGAYTKLKNVETIRCRELEVITNCPQYVHNDGEVLGEYRHLKVRCGEGKLRMPEV